MKHAALLSAHRSSLIAALLGLAAYSLLIWLDLPPPAGLRYAPAPGQGLTPAHWWDEMQGLRGWGVYPSGWSWALIDPAPLARWLPLLALGLLGAALLWANRDQGSGIRDQQDSSNPQLPTPNPRALIPLVALGYLGQLAALGLKQPNANQILVDRILNRAFTGYFTSATQIPDPATFFVGYADAIRVADPALRLCGHCRTHPPGPLLFYWLPMQGGGLLPADVLTGLRDGLARLLGLTLPPLPPAQAIVAILAGHVILLGAALIVMPLYGLARRLAGPRWALPGAALGLVVPGILLMSPEFDQVYATAVAALFYLALRGLTAARRAGWWGLAAGGWLAGCLYGSFGLWVLIGPLLALAVAAGAGALRRAPQAGAADGPRPWAAVGAWLGGLAVGVAVPWALLWGWGRFDLPAVLQIAGTLQLQGITEFRPYGPWVVFNLVDFLQFVGLPLVVVSLATLVHRAPDASPALPPGPPWVRRAGAWLAAHLNLYSLLFWGSILVLDVSGTTRAEVGRLWLFLVPLALLDLYHALGTGRLGGRALAALLAAQFLVCLLIGGRWLTP